MSSDLSHWAPTGSACPSPDLAPSDRFRFDRPPFALAPDADFMFWTEGHRRAAECLEWGIDHGSPVILLTGEIGAGKTTLVQGFLANRRPDLTTGLLSYLGSGGDLCAWVLLAFDRPIPEGPSTSQFSALRAFVLAERQASRRCILIVEEAQCATDDELEALRQLTSMDTGRNTPLQVVLVGQPDLRTRLGDARHAPLAARVGAGAHLSRMSQDDTAGYVKHRLARAGGRTDTFAPGALVEVHGIARGIPRATNLLCDLCVTEAVRRGAVGIDAALVREVAAVARRQGTLAHLAARRGEGDVVPMLPTAPTPIAPIPGEAAPQGTKQRAAEDTRRASESRPARVPTEPARGTGNVAAKPPVSPTRSASRPAWPAATEPAANSPSRAAPAENPSPPAEETQVAAAQAEKTQPASSGARGEDAEDVRQLAFDAMASLADRQVPKARRHDAPRTAGTQTGKRPGAERSEQEEAARAKPAPPVSRTRSLGLGPSTVAVGVVVLGLGLHIAWSVVDAVSAAAIRPNAITVAAPELPLVSKSGPVVVPSHANVSHGGSDRAAGRGAPDASRPALTTPALPTIADPQISAAGLFSLALDLALVDQETAAIAFARAASRGHARAARYLAQLYETGDGVPRNLALARAWYSASTARGAESHATLLVEDAPPGTASAPLLLSAARTSDGMLELVWTSATEGNGVEYQVEVFDGAGGALLHSQSIAHSSYRMPAPDGELLWRVTVRTPSAVLESDLQRIPAVG